ncbi:hypothetical protein Taro_024084 [Colocasia esculenta]|uniref:Uncharacterized protein n=1 Tax=Colocasia esculenta TaxID=4460 RepID=A0A843V5W4_COLES|nr:hypothetical protein [Colocasia esculenta]
MPLFGQQGIPSSHHQQNAGLVASLQAILYHAQGEHQPPTLLVKIRHNVCPRREISSKEKAVNKTKLILKVGRDWMVQDTDHEKSWENMANLHKTAPHHTGRLEGHR